MAKKKKGVLTEKEREIIEKIDELVVIRDYLRLQKKDEDKRTNWLKSFVAQSPTHIIDGIKAWAKDDGKALHLAYILLGSERPIPKETLIQLVGFNNVVDLLEPMSFTRLIELARNKKLKKLNGKLITPEELDRIFPSREKLDGAKLSVRTRPTGTDIEKVIGRKSEKEAEDANN